MSKPITIRIRDKRLWDDFRAFVLDKYGTKHTVMAVEIECALYHHLGRNEWPGYEQEQNIEEGADGDDTCTHTKKFKPREERFFLSFYRQFFMDELVSNTVLSDFIRQEAGVKDWRAVRSWRELLESIGWIESPGPRSKKWILRLSPEKFDELLGEVGV